MIGKTLILLFILLISPFVLATTTLTAELDNSSIRLGETARVTLTLQGVRSSSAPQVPQIEGLEIIAVGQSSSVSIVNGEMSIQQKYMYHVEANREGLFQISPFQIMTATGILASNSLTFEVAKGVKPDTDTNSNANKNILPAFWIEQNIDLLNPVVSMPLVYSLKLYARVEVTDITPQWPDFKDWIAEEVLTDIRQTEMVNGVKYATWEKQFILTPLKPGEFLLPPTQLKLTYKESGPNSFFATMRGATIKSNDLLIQVHELPPAPNGFSGFVGEFTIAVQLEPQKIYVNDTVHLKIIVTGRGNLDFGTAPVLEFAGFKFYPAKPQIKKHKTDLLNGTKEFNFDLVPQQSGDYTLVLPDFVYFDMQQQEYKTLSLPQNSLKVLPLNDEMLAPKPIEYPESAPKFNKWHYKMLFFISGLLGLVLMSAKFVFKKSTANVYLVRAKKLSKLLNKQKFDQFEQEWMFLYCDYLQKSYSTTTAYDVYLAVKDELSAIQELILQNFVLYLDAKRLGNKTIPSFPDYAKVAHFTLDYFLVRQGKSG